MPSGRQVPWTEMVKRKAEFIGGQIQGYDEGNRGGTVRSEIADIKVDGNGIVSITTTWSASRRTKDHWEKDDRYVSYGGVKEWVYSPEEQPDGSLTFGIRMIHGDIDIFPKGHASNIKKEDVVGFEPTAV